LAVHLLQPAAAVEPDGINLSEGGLCLRLQEALEVRSLVRLELSRLADGQHVQKSAPVECAGRVAWVTQRVDLRAGPPFLYDTGIEFVNPPAWIRRLVASVTARPTVVQPATGRSALEPIIVRGRRLAPQVAREAGRRTRWHLVVLADGVPCFSGHYASGRLARAAWEQFKRREARA
jgi:hypothetical protein